MRNWFDYFIDCLFVFTIVFGVTGLGLFAVISVHYQKPNFEALTQASVLVGDDTKDFCSGSVISKGEHKLVLTAAHCVRDQVTTEVDPRSGEKRLTIKPMIVSTDKDHHYTAYVVSLKKDGDQALLEIIDPTFNPTSVVKLAPKSAKLNVGDPVWTVSNPVIRYTKTVTHGIISQLNRKIFELGSFTTYFQIDAFTFAGSSGGMIVNKYGELIGTVSGGAPGTLINFEAPVITCYEMLEELGYNI